MFTDKTKVEIVSTAAVFWHETENSSPMALAELACNASRMKTLGFAESENEVHRLVNKYGWIKVRNAAARLF